MNRPFPAEVISLRNYKIQSIKIGYRFVLCLANNTLFSWGRNDVNLNIYNSFIN
jgi:hypothetical protein